VNTLQIIKAPATLQDSLQAAVKQGSHENTEYDEMVLTDGLTDDRYAEVWTGAITPELQDVAQTLLRIQREPQSRRPKNTGPIWLVVEEPEGAGTVMAKDFDNWSNALWAAEQLLGFRPTLLRQPQLLNRQTSRSRAGWSIQETYQLRPYKLQLTAEIDLSFRYQGYARLAVWSPATLSWNVVASLDLKSKEYDALLERLQKAYHKPATTKFFGDGEISRTLLLQAMTILDFPTE
jgi:hypothetical protein